MKILLCIDWSAVGFGFRLKGDKRGTKSQMLCGQWEIQIWKRTKLLTKYWLGFELRLFSL